MATKVSKRITSQTIRENTKRDLSPNKEGYTVEQLRDIGCIAAVMTAVSRVMAG